MVYSVTRFSVMHLYEAFGHIHNYITKITLNLLQNHRDIHIIIFPPAIFNHIFTTIIITRTEKFNGIFFHDCWFSVGSPGSSTKYCTVYNVQTGKWKWLLSEIYQFCAVHDSQATCDAKLNWTVWAFTTHSRAGRADRSFLTSRQQTTRLRTKVSVTCKKYEKCSPVEVKWSFNTVTIMHKVTIFLTLNKW